MFPSRLKLTISMTLWASSTHSISKYPAGASSICCFSLSLASAIWGRKLCNLSSTNTQHDRPQVTPQQIFVRTFNHQRNRKPVACRKTACREVLFVSPLLLGTLSVCRELPVFGLRRSFSLRPSSKTNMLMMSHAGIRDEIRIRVKRKMA